MAVDVRQRFRAYRVGMRFFRDDPSRITFVRWYSVPDTTPPVPFANQFYSRRWERGLPELPIGEPLNWLGLARDFPPAGITGLHACGSAEQWLNGCLTTDPLPPLNPANGLRICCGSTIQVGQGGEAEGGVQAVLIPACPTTPIPVAITLEQLTFATGYINASRLRFLWNGTTWACIDNYVIPSTSFNTNTWTAGPIGSSNIWDIQGAGLLSEGGAFINCTLPYFTNIGESGISFPIGQVFLWRFVAGWYPANVAAGGEAEGGRGWILIPPLQLAQGGEAEGGEGSSQQAQLAQGGEAEGGTASSARNFTGQGGEAEGGEGVVLPLEYAQGGEAEGGSGFLIPLQLGAGGEAEGGSASP